MILDDTILINVSGQTKQRYVDLGYKVPEIRDRQGRIRTPRGTKIEVRVRDLPINSHEKIRVKCDCCEEIVTPTYQAYNSKIEKYGNYVCSACRNNHQKITLNAKYNVDNSSQILSVKEKKEQKSIEKYGTKNVLQNEEIKEKIKLTNYEKYGKFSYTQTDEYLEKKNATIVQKYGSQDLFKEYVKEQIKKTNQDKYGVEWYTQTDDYRIKSMKTFLDNGSVPTSSQQIYIHNLYGGILNYGMSGYFLDIYLPDNQVDIEVDFGGHDLRVKTGQITQEEFDMHEMIREKLIRSNGIKIIRLISPHDKMPSDNKLIELYNFAISYFNSGHTWIYFYIEENKYRNAKYRDNNGAFYDFGKLRNGKKLSNINREEVA